MVNYQATVGLIQEGAGGRKEVADALSQRDERSTTLSHRVQPVSKHIRAPLLVRRKRAANRLAICLYDRVCERYRLNFEDYAREFVELIVTLGCERLLRKG